ncbi:hypothetical protein C1T17_02535 [Sphingobium sp. SCG-1]|uniref:nuclear transport factor 2 family protein n=1 Tax=Sphingobium sp. SCG-1 TaxID=2072936 RepID=UPI000CD69C24|nr:nuclear transport factor 2 family protein [Sphingobium sp. SCG-1]AUW57128.1 hypothetical protein C1T17_02535 [Sphingobium sp. SCG-1]
MNDYQAITNLEHRFIESLDQRNVAAVAAMFGDDGTLEMTVPGFPPMSGTGASEVSQLLERIIPTPSAGHIGRHILSNHVIDIDQAAGSAEVRMYSCLFTVSEGTPVHCNGFGRHYDKLKLVDGTWCFSHKLIQGDVRIPPPSQG